jgi:hypothetical protein
MSHSLKNALLTFMGIVLVCPALLLAADSKASAFVGTWVMNPKASNITDGREITMTIQEVNGQVKVETVIHKGGTVTKTEFGCGTNGKDCEFEESGHKSKISMWFNGSDLVCCKTGGPETDEVSQWKMEVSPDSKTLKVMLSHITPAAKDEVLVYDRKSSTN